jgi:glucokinase
LSTDRTGPVLALAVTGRVLEAGVLSGADDWLHLGSVPSGSEHGPPAVIDAVLDCAAELMARHSPLAVGLVVPGLIEERSGLAVSSVHLNWRDVPLARWLQEEVGVPVAFGHDVRAAALAEAQRGAGRGCRSLLYLSAGSGVAAAAVLDGRVLAGGRGRAGELGHLVVDGDGPACRCGSRGCVESLGSARALVRRYRAAVGGPAAPSAVEVLRRARTGDEAAAAVHRDAVEALAAGLAPAVAMLDPRRVVVGGWPALAGADALPDLRAALARRLGSHADPALVPAALGDRGTRLGAALLARTRLGDRRAPRA